MILPVDSQDTDSLSIRRHASVTVSPEKSGEQSVANSYSVPEQDVSERKDSSLPKRESITFSRTKPGMLLRPAHRRRPSGTRIDSEVLPTETKPNPDAKFSFDAHAGVASLPEPAHARRLSYTKLDAEVLLVPVEDAKVSLENPNTRSPAVDVRRPLNFNFNQEVFSITTTESKLLENKRNPLNSRAVMNAHTGLAPKEPPKESIEEDTPSNMNALKKLGKMLPETPKPGKCEFCTKKSITSTYCLFSQFYVSLIVLISNIIET